MGLDVELPDPPSLRGPTAPGDYDAVEETDERVGDDYRREELAGFLEAGAWQEAFEEWAAHTLLTEEEFQVLVDLGLIDGIDLYWNPAEEDVGYRTPPIPADLPAPYDERLDRGDVGAIEEALDALGRTVSEVLENDYVQRDEEAFGFFSEE